MIDSRLHHAHHLPTLYSLLFTYRFYTTLLFNFESIHYTIIIRETSDSIHVACIQNSTEQHRRTLWEADFYCLIRGELATSN